MKDQVDLVVLDADFLNVPEDEIDEIAAALTFVGGVVVYDDPLQVR